ncbi:ABC transporter ATP-binding protein [Desulfosporosinus sp. FKA]|uniref:ABC transporter ATP-binding protein n=1 Tax=Desulfosporosinus sp. FKA TaxID=1969834 RepID=UPI000B4A3619|nr:ABC transporter ATP-binding protein [Desulfosporosinus sp. FKA]
MAEKLLEVKDLKVSFHTKGGIVPAVNGVSFNIHKGESLGIVGESGCGKSVTALSIMKLIPEPAGTIDSGEILYREKDILLQGPQTVRDIRGNRISMIFQEPMTSLNPVLTIGRQIGEVFERHQSLSRKQGLTKAVELLELVGIPMASRRIKEYPHQFSGGMRQRVMIAAALACSPELLIADEPTTALDVTIQAQILKVLRHLCQTKDMALMLITHDLGVIAEMTQRVIVMYAGKVMEEAPVRKLFKQPEHPYTMALLASMPYFYKPKNSLFAIRGAVQEGDFRETGCVFQSRCDFAQPICLKNEPPLVQVEGERFVRCWRKAEKWLEGGRHE